MLNDWIKLEEQPPTEKDLPFITHGKKLTRFPKSKAFFPHNALWEDSDWFLELDDYERDEWIWWQTIKGPKEQ